MRYYVHYDGAQDHTWVYVCEETKDECVRDLCCAFLKDYQTMFPGVPFVAVPEDVSLVDDNGSALAMDTKPTELEDRSDVFITLLREPMPLAPLAAAAAPSPTAAVPAAAKTKAAVAGGTDPVLIQKHLGAISLAKDSQSSGNLRKARDQYQASLNALKSLGTQLEPLHPVWPLRQICTQQLGVIYSHNKFWDQSMEYFAAAVDIAERAREATAFTKPKDNAVNAREVARLLQFLGQSHYGLQDYSAASTVFGRALTLLRGLPAKVNKEQSAKTQMQDLKIWLARTLYALQSVGDNKQIALGLFEGSLKDNDDHIDTLAYYSLIAIDHGQVYQAIPYLLRALVQCSKDGAAVTHETTRVVCTTLASVVKDPKGVKALLTELHSAATSPSALIFLAQTIKDYGAVQSSIALYEKAAKNPLAEADKKCNMVLNIVHTHEVRYQYQDAFNWFKSYLADHPLERIGTFDPACVYDAIKGLVDIFDLKLRRGTSQHCPAYMAPPVIFDAKKVQVHVPGSKPEAKRADTKPYSPAELSLLAICFTAVKILYVCGALQVIPHLVSLLEPLRLHRELHLTTIRNEHAYYSCVSQALHSVPFPLYPAGSAPEAIFVVGDSHCLSSAWQRLEVGGRSYLLTPKLVTGLKCWHLRDDCKFYTRRNFECAMRSIPDGSTVIFNFGEIDCREGLLVAVEKCKYETIEEGIEKCINVYTKTLEDLVKAKKLRAYIHPVVPVLDITRPTVKHFNSVLAPRVKRSKVLQWLDFFDQLLLPDGTFDTQYSLDGTHLHPAYVKLVQGALQTPHKALPL